MRIVRSLVMAETSFLAPGVLHCFDDTTVLPRVDEGTVDGLSDRERRPGPWRVLPMITEVIICFLRFWMMAHANHAGLIRPVPASATGTTRQRPVARRRRSPPTMQPRRGPAEARSGPSRRGKQEY